jgi:hypothetical protein
MRRKAMLVSREPRTNVLIRLRGQHSYSPLTILSMAAVVMAACEALSRLDNHKMVILDSANQTGEQHNGFRIF